MLSQERKKGSVHREALTKAPCEESMTHSNRHNGPKDGDRAAYNNVGEWPHRPGSAEKIRFHSKCSGEPLNSLNEGVVGMISFPVLKSSPRTKEYRRKPEGSFAKERGKRVEM